MVNLEHLLANSDRHGFKNKITYESSRSSTKATTTEVRKSTVKIRQHDSHDESLNERKQSILHL